MLRRFLGLAILLTALPLAGVPALACAAQTPTHNCCPEEPLAPCGDDGSSAAVGYALQAHCAQAVSAPLSLAVAESPKDIEKQPNQPDPSPLATSFAGSFASQLGTLRPRSGYHTRSSFASPAPLYLSTGRLRL